MTTATDSTPAGGLQNSPAFRTAYRVFAYFGLMSFTASLLYGFRYDPAAPAVNYLYNVLLYVAFATPHLVMTAAWFKRPVWGDPTGSPGERRVYITITIVTWLLVFWLHWPVPGGSVIFPAAIAPVVTFAGMAGLLFFVMLFFEGSTLPAIDRLLGVPGSLLSHTHSAETPLFTEGPYASVRHPMYRAALLVGLCSLVIHPNAGQLLWALLLGGTFIGFIPVEEGRLIAARGEDYRRYQQQTPYRLFKGVW